MPKHLAIYCRASSKQQKLDSQLPDLKKWAEAQTVPVVWYTDKVTGKSMDRPGWMKLHKAMKQGNVLSLIVWRLDRLGRLASGLTALFDELQLLKVNFVSLREGFDLSTPAGRMVAGVLASQAQYETEVRGERVAAGQAAARARGKTWGGSKPGRRKASDVQVAAIRQLHQQHHSVNAISKAIGLSRPTVTKILQS